MTSSKRYWNTRSIFVVIPFDLSCWVCFQSFWKAVQSKSAHGIAMQSLPVSRSDIFRYWNPFFRFIYNFSSHKAVQSINILKYIIILFMVKGAWTETRFIVTQRKYTCRLLKYWISITRESCGYSAFLVVPNFHSSFYNSIAARNMFSISILTS